MAEHVFGDSTGWQDVRIDGAKSKLRLLAHDNAGGSVWIQGGTEWKHDSACNIIFSTMFGTTAHMTLHVDGQVSMRNGAKLTAGGVWTDASSREFKEDIESLSTDEALSALNGLEPVQFTYKADPTERHVGFIAEDVPDLVAQKDRKGLSPMDIVAVLTRVVKDQQKQIAALQARFDHVSGVA